MGARNGLVLGGVCVSGIVVLLGTAGCQGSATWRDRLSSPNPLDRAQAVVAVYARRDAEAIPKLVDLLEDPDSAVRMYAIVALRRLCGEDFGYRFYESAALRDAAVDRWRAALRAGEVRLRPLAQAAASDSEPGPSESNTP
jgi:hypothetical protein